MAQLSTIGQSGSALSTKCDEVQEETSIKSCSNAEFWLRKERPPTHTTTVSTKMVLAPALQYSNSFFIKGPLYVWGGAGGGEHSGFSSDILSLHPLPPSPQCKYKYVGVYRNHATITQGRDS